jgi:NAD(P)-dependent dehydrogenase (short-subunit alcohol dehydrogenase family)
MSVRRALVTGAAHGIGAAIATRLGSAGYRVGVLDMDGTAAAEVAAALPDALPLTADVTDADSIDRALDAFGEPPNLLVNNAGIVHFGPVVEESVADFVKVISVNLIGCDVASPQCAHQMSGGDHIIRITSINDRPWSSPSGAFAPIRSVPASSMPACRHPSMRTRR